MRISAKKTTGPTFEIEAGLFAKGYSCIAGIDEAGRGALAGPLVVGLVIYDTAHFASPSAFEGIRDSKCINARQREACLATIKPLSRVSMHIAISREEVDLYNVNGATRLAVERLIRQSPVAPDVIIMDGNFKFAFDIPFFPVVKGDSRSLSIASASIEAKVHRDVMMCQLAHRYSGYGFEIHKGYGTAMHLEALKKLGPCEIHRRSYEPVRSMVTGGMQ